jgi:hypothetical protein
VATEIANRMLSVDVMAALGLGSSLAIPVEEPDHVLGVLVSLAAQPRADLFQPGRQGDVEEPGNVTGSPVHVLDQVLVHDLQGP